MLRLTDAALRRPVTVIVVVLAVALSSILALLRMKRDIFPDLGVPVIYVAQPYGGMDPAQMEGYLTYYYEYHFLFINGIEHIESRNIQNAALIKLQFHPGTDMAQAMAETVTYVDRARAYMPQGTLPPFVLRLDAGSMPVGDLVFRSETRSLGELQDLALNVVRPLFATLPGVSAPAPFGASQRTIVVRVDSKKLRFFNLSPVDVAQAISDANMVVPSGNIHVGKLYSSVPLNSVVRDIKELEDVPIRTGTEQTVFLKDIGTVADSSDIQMGYALIDGRRSIYMPVTKRASASTLAVVSLVRANLQRFQNVLPRDVKVSYEFDQSGYVRSAIASLLTESLTGAALTGLVILLFLADLVSALVVIATIPVSLLAALTGLWLTGQTVNLMTLGGLALAVGILVDEATVTVENIDTHLAQGQTASRAVLSAAKETVVPRLLAMLSVISVFVSSFFMSGVPRALFIPLSLAVGFSMVASFLLSSTLVPVLAARFLRGSRHEVGKIAPHSRFGELRRRYARLLERLMRRRRLLVASYAVGTTALIFLLSGQIGREIFPRTDTGQFEMKLLAPTGTSIENTQEAADKALDIIKREAGAGNVESSIGYVGTQPTSFPINLIYLWTSGPHEAILDVTLKRGSKIEVEEFKERLRATLRHELPELKVSFEASGVVNKVMSGDAPDPIEVAVYGVNYEADRAYAEKIRDALSRLPHLRDVQITQAFDYPTVEINVDRKKAGYMGLTIAKIGRALVPATSSSRYIFRNYWAEPESGITHQIQVEVPQEQVDSPEKLKDLPVTVNGGAIPLRRFAQVTPATAIGEYDRNNMQRMVTVTANLSGEDLGRAASAVLRTLASLAAQRPHGATVQVRGQVETMEQMLKGLGLGLAVAIMAILMLLAAYFESPRHSFIVVSSVPAVIIGVELMLLVTGMTFNVESLIGAIMATGIAVANAILLVSFAKQHRESGASSAQAAIDGAQARLRPILMTSVAMIAGMLPLAWGLREGSQETMPLGAAVIGGLACATAATLLIVPLVYAAFAGDKPHRSSSLHPDDHP